MGTGEAIGMSREAYRSRRCGDFRSESAQGWLDPDVMARFPPVDSSRPELAVRLHPAH